MTEEQIRELKESKCMLVFSYNESAKNVGAYHVGDLNILGFVLTEALAKHKQFETYRKFLHAVLREANKMERNNIIIPGNTGLHIV